MTKCPPELKKLLDENIKKYGYQYDNELEEKRWDIINKFYDENPIDKKCEFSDCKKEVIETKINLAGGVVSILCKEHKKWYDEHVRTFSIL